MTDQTEQDALKKKIFTTNLIVASAAFVVLFAAQIAIFAAFLTISDPDDRLSAIGMVGSWPYFVLVPATAFLSVISSVRYAGLYRRKVLTYIKRCWMRIFYLLLTYILVVVLYNFVLSFFKELTPYPLANALILNIPAFVIFTAVIYRLVCRWGYKDAEAGRFDLNFHLVAWIYFFIIISDNIVSANTTAPTANPHLALIPLFLTYGDGFFFPLLVISLLVTVAVETLIFVYAYRKGKRRFIEDQAGKEVSDPSHQTDDHEPVQGERETED